jgi:hypothetical protein
MWNKNATVFVALGCLTVLSMPARSQDDLQAVHIIVEGKGPVGGNLAFKFHQFVRESVGSEFGYDYGEVATPITCEFVKNNVRSCDELLAADGHNGLKLEYLTFRDTRHMSLFLQAWDRVIDTQSAHNNPTPISMTFDAKVPPGDCTNPGDAKQPCVNAPQCPYTTPRRCDKYLGAPCSSCGNPP